MKELSFNIQGPWLTNLTRSLWADEGEPEKAINILKAGFPDMEESDMLAILTGTKKLVGDSNDGVLLEPDTATKGPHGHSLSIDHVLSGFRKQAEEGQDAIDLLSDNVEYMASPRGLVAVPRRRVSAYRDGKVKLIDVLYRGRKVYAYSGEEDDDTLCQQQKIQTTCTPKRQVDVDEILKDAPEPTPHTPPDPEYKITNDTGWLTTDGEFYRCEYGQHIDLADRLNREEKQLEAMGWIKLAGTEYGILEPDKPMTQPQRDLIFDWCQQQGKDLPMWWDDEP